MAKKPTTNSSGIDSKELKKLTNEIIKQNPGIKNKEAKEQATRQLEVQHFKKNYNISDRDYNNPLIRRQLQREDVRKSLVTNRADTLSRLRKNSFLTNVDTTATTSTSITKRVAANLYKFGEDKVYGVLGEFGDALKQSRRTSTAAEAKAIRKDYYLRSASNFIEKTFGVPGAAIAQRIRQNISTIKADDPKSSFQAIKQNFTSITATLEQYDKMIERVDRKAERSHLRIEKLIRVNNLKKDSNDSPDRLNSASDLTEISTNVNALTLTNQYGDLAAKVAALEGIVSNKVAALEGNNQSTVPLVSKVETKKEKEDDGSLLPNLILLLPKLLPGILAVLGILGAGAAAAGGIAQLQNHVNKVRKNANPNRVGGWDPNTDPWQKTADRQALQDLVNDDAKRDEYEKKSKQTYDEMSTVDKIKHNIKTKGLAKGSMFPSVSGLWDRMFGKSKKKDDLQSTLKQLRERSANINDPVGDRIHQDRVEQQKSQFMQFGKLPQGFEFLPGHMGRLGQSSAVEAAGASPVTSRTSSGSTHFGNQNYNASGITNPNAIIATSEEAKKVIADAVAGKIPLEAAAVDRALKLEGLNEHRDRDTLKKFLAQGGRAIDPVNTPWCAAFVNATLAGAGIYGTGSNVATSFSNWGEMKQAAELKKGDVLVQHRGRAPGETGETGGHVGIATGKTRKDKNGNITHVEMLGGNQRGATDVSVNMVPVDQLQIRRATENQYSPEAKEALGLTKPGTAVYERSGNYEKVSGGIDRSQFEDELKNPDVRERFFTLMRAEVGSQGPEAQQAFAETVMNRAAVTGKSINQIISNTKYYQPYQDGGFSRAQRTMTAENRKQYAEIIDKVKAGSDLTKGATHNASAGVAASARRGGYDSVKDSLIEVNREWFYRKKYEDNSKLKRLPKETVKQLNLDSPKLTGAPNLDGITKINSDPSMPKITYPHAAPDVTGDVSTADAKRISGETDAIGIEPGKPTPKPDIGYAPGEERIMAPPVPAPSNEMESLAEAADKNTIDQINAAAPNLDYNQRTGANKPATNNAPNTTDSPTTGGGSAHQAESRPPQPGTGGFGSHMRCFLAIAAVVLTINMFTKMLYINNLDETSMEKTKYEQISYMVQPINRNTS